jgi:NAD(P)-dependent dehydrogenase (short-subunit alcohol dehydrogenase family)
LNKKSEGNFSLKGKVAVVTGGLGLLGQQHCEAIAKHGGIPVILENKTENSLTFINHLQDKYDCKAKVLQCDITQEKNVTDALDEILSDVSSLDILINNAAIDHKVSSYSAGDINSFENFCVDQWNKELNVGLTGAMICTKIFGSFMNAKDGGTILNISSDLGIIGPDQRIYKQSDNQQSFFKPVTYSVIKHGIIGLTKYTATYWPNKIRCNALCPGGILNNQSPEFIKKLENLIPMGRMAHLNEYQSTVVFLISDASSYMTGGTLVVDGGRSCW